MSSFALNLASLGQGMPGLTSAQGTSFAEAAAVCLENVEHASGVSCQMIGNNNFAIVTIAWDQVTDQQRAAHADMQEATEEGASGIAILAVRAVTGLTVRERPVKGTGVDYWLGKGDFSDDDLPFQRITRLETSGILSGNKHTLENRVQQKLAQTYPTDHICPALIAVVEFGQPVVHLESK